MVFVNFRCFVSMVTMELYSVIMAPVVFLGRKNGERNLFGPGPMHVTAKLRVSKFSLLDEQLLCLLLSAIITKIQRMMGGFLHQ